MGLLRYDLRRKATEFIEQYVRIPPELLDGGVLGYEALHLCIRFLLTERVFTAQELKKEILRDCGIILPQELYEMG